MRDHANLYTVQLDNGVPWEAALAGSAIDAGLMDQWRRHKESIAAHHQVYLAIAPLAEDRVSWASAPEGRKAPSWAREQQLTEQLKTAYTRYVLQAVEYFHPAYLNVGVEAGDMAAKRPSKWPLFESLFTHVVKEVRAKYPSLKIGISFGLPLLQEKGVLERAKTVVSQSDYVGISFYPYMSDFYVKLGAAPLPAPPDQWRKPLEWLSRNVRKPIAICETAYASEPVTLSRPSLRLDGDPDLQSRYVADLATIARRDHYLFTAFFLAVDYDALMEKIRPGDETTKLWRRTGFFDKNLVAKPAWSSYRQAWLRQSNYAPAAVYGPKPAPADADNARSGELGFDTPGGPFVAPAPDKIRIEKSLDRGLVMQWEYAYEAGKFAWAVKQVPIRSGTGSRGLSFELRSDRSTPLLVQVEESDGETFYHVTTPRPAWTSVKVPWADFRPDPAKKRGGTLDAEHIVRIMLADAAAVNGQVTGTRRVDLARISFLREDK